MISVLVCVQLYKLKSVTSRTQPYARFVIHTSISLASEIEYSKTVFQKCITIPDHHRAEHGQGSSKHRSLVSFLFFSSHISFSILIQCRFKTSLQCISMKKIISYLFEPKIDSLSFNFCWKYSTSPFLR